MDKETAAQSGVMICFKSYLEGVMGGPRTRPQVSGLPARFISAVLDFVTCPSNALGQHMQEC